MIRRWQAQEDSAQSRQFRVCSRSDLARLYQVEVKALNQAVKRNSSRFPGDFMFQLTAVEAESLRSQVVTLDGVAAAVSSAQGRGKHLKYRPYAWTGQGVKTTRSLGGRRTAVAITANGWASASSVDMSYHRRSAGCPPPLTTKDTVERRIT
jgi:hypothetical protein